MFWGFWQLHRDNCYSCEEVTRSFVGCNGAGDVGDRDGTVHKSSRAGDVIFFTVNSSNKHIMNKRWASGVVYDTICKFVGLEVECHLPFVHQHNSKAACCAIFLNPLWLCPGFISPNLKPIRPN